MRIERIGPFDVKYERGHSYSEEWNSTELYCPHCGTQSVWVKNDGGDYYEGPQHLCLNPACLHTFSLPRLHPADGWQDAQRIEAISGVAIPANKTGNS